MADVMTMFEVMFLEQDLDGCMQKKKSKNSLGDM
jgi:hypothetical protein